VEEAFRRSYTLYDTDELVDLLDPALAPAVHDVVSAHETVYEDNELADAVSRMCLADTRMFMQGLNLTYTDRASMAASTEVRVPFIDTSVFTAAFSLPGKEKIRGRVQKAALKDVARQWLPDEIIDRPKASFGAPLRAWVTNDLREVVDDVLVRGELVSSGFLRRDPLVRLIEDQRSGRRDEAKQVWQLLTLELWYRHARAAGVGTA
jgi:asparagine synthase (glutamine-hydrolysing)